MCGKEGGTCYEIKDFPPPFSPETTPYRQMDFAETVKTTCSTTGTGLNDLRMCKVIVLGDVNVGKTSIVNRFCRQSFSNNYKATIGVDFEIQQFNILNVPFNVQIWDTAGQERFRCIAAAYYRSAHVIVTVFDLTSKTSLHHSIEWINEALKANFETPLKFLVGTKMDLLINSVYEKVEDQATKMAKSIGAEYWAVSSRTGEGIRDLFYRIAALSFEKVLNSELNTSDREKPLPITRNYICTRNDSRDSERKGCKTSGKTCRSN